VLGLKHGVLHVKLAAMDKTQACVEHSRNMDAGERRLGRLLYTGFRLPFTGYRLWLLLILLTAVFLRFYRLGQIPPGLTHDEAAHGLTAWEIVSGQHALYFTIGYGREPLYDYVNALLMAYTGPHWLPLRVTAVAFSLILIAGMAAWVRRAFDPPTALLTAAGLAVSFWPLMASRQALRSIALPALFVLAVYFFWLAWEGHLAQRGKGAEGQRKKLFWAVVSGLFLGLTFYTYIPARVMWLVLPLTAVYAWLIDHGAWYVARSDNPLRTTYHAQRSPLLYLLLTMLLVAAPLLSYLYLNPTVEERVSELSLPLAQAAEGNIEPLFSNAAASLQLFTVSGDTAWRYNVPQRPFLLPLLGILFYLGLAGALWRALRPLWYRPDPSPKTAVACCLALLWLLAGFAPVLVTGPELATTQAIGAQPVLYLFPALALAYGERRAARQWPSVRPLLPLAALLLFGYVTVDSARAYFGQWANAPAVREQYETTMMAVMGYLNEADEMETAVSTITPHPVHSPALALLAHNRPDANLHWFDGRGSLLLPPAPHSRLVFPGYAPLPDALTPFLQTATLHHTIPMRPTDLDRPVYIYLADRSIMLAGWREQLTATPGVTWSDVAHLRGYALLTPSVPAGGVVQVITWWQVERPLPDARLFLHMQGEDGAPLAQADRLDVPGAGWQPGTMFLQLHEFTVPADVPAGEYPLAVGLYTFAETEGPRLPITVDGRPVGHTVGHTVGGSYILTTIVINDA
jgi:hypothetical protein